MTDVAEYCKIETTAEILKSAESVICVSAVWGSVYFACLSSLIQFSSDLWLNCVIS
jgi:hypothetical protein